MPMLVADEMGADWAKLRGVLAPAAVHADPVFGMQMTGGCSAVANSWLQYFANAVVRLPGQRLRELPFRLV